MCSHMRDTYLRYNYFVREHVSRRKTMLPESREWQQPEEELRLGLQPEEDVLKAPAGFSNASVFFFPPTKDTEMTVSHLLYLSRRQPNL